MKVLIITYYWPPAGGSGVQRWLKFVKYLQDFGVESVVYTVDNPQYEVNDSSLIKEIPLGVEVLKKSIIEPNRFINNKKVATATVSANPSFIQKVKQYIRGNYFIPDARMLWIKPSVRYLKKYLKQHPEISTVISTGPPHSMHVIAMHLQKKLGVKWLADFRDPMSNLFYNDDLMLSKKAKIKLKQLEKKIIQNADSVITVSNSLKNEFEKHRVHVDVITNGFDDEVLNKEAIILDSKFSIAHIGLFPHQSNSEVLWEVLCEIGKELSGFLSDLEIKLIGNVSNVVTSSIVQNGLAQYMTRIHYVSHCEAIKKQKESQVLLLVIPRVKGAKGIITGKMFEYITSNRPILAIGPVEGDAASIVKKTNTGYFCDFNDREKIKAIVLEMYAEFKMGNLSVSPTNINQYRRKMLTEQLSKILKTI